MKATNIQIISLQKQSLQGRYTLYPAQRPQKIGETTDSTLDTPLNRATYCHHSPTRDDLWH